MAGKLPGLEGDSPELERVAANSVGDAIRTGQGEGKALIAAGAEFRKSATGETTFLPRPQYPKLVAICDFFVRSWASNVTCL